MANSFQRFLADLAKFRRSPKKAEPGCGACGMLDAQQSGWYQHATGELLKGFTITAEDTVIDVGCGEGGASAFAVARGAKVIATDVDQAAVESMRRKMRKRRAKSFQAFVSDSNPLPVEDETATKVVSMEVLEHVDDPKQFISELVRVGKPGASYLLTVPDPSSESVQETLAPPAYWSKPNHLRVFTREEFDQLVEEAGLEIQKRAYKSFYWAMWWILFWASDQEFGTPEGPILANWTRTWHSLITSAKGRQVKEALDEFMPKSQAIIARKAA